jgi:hypothetical protein
MLALMLDISFVTTRSIQSYDLSWKKKLKNGVITLEEIREAAKTQLGVVREFTVTLRADKSHLGLGEPIPHQPNYEEIR